MKVYFLRHGIAVEPGEWTGGDFDRPLTDEGRKRMKDEAKAMKGLGMRLELIVTSPLVRAKETAEFVASALKLRDRTIEDQRLGNSFDVRALADVLSDHSDAGDVMLVGHEPSMSKTIGDAIGSARIDLKKGGLACVEFSDAASASGTLLWLVPPKVILP